MVSVSQEIEITGPQEAVWAIWKEPRKWPFWDPAYTAVLFSPPFEKGAVGNSSEFGEKMRPFKIESLITKRGFYDTTPYFGCTVESHHCVKEVRPGVVRVRHEKRFKGPLALFYFFKRGLLFRRSLKKALKNLKLLIEQDSQFPQGGRQDTARKKSSAPKAVV